MTRTNERKAYCFAGSQVVAEEFNAECAVLDPCTARYFSLASGAALVWPGLAPAASPGELSASPPARSHAAASLVAFVESAINAGLLREAERPANVGASDLAERIAATGDTFALEAFDDLTELRTAELIR